MAHDCSAAGGSHGHHHHTEDFEGSFSASEAEMVAEKLHFKDVINAFRDYSNWMEAELRRRENHAAALPERYKALLPPGIMQRKLQGCRSAVQRNQAFLSELAQAQLESGFGPQFEEEEEQGDGAPGSAAAPGAGSPSKVGPDSTPSAGGAAVAGSGLPSSPPLGLPWRRPTSSAAHFSKVKSTLHQLVREWSAEGAAERRQCYDPLIAELQRHLPVTAGNRNKQRVCIPGCGLGRLVFECAARGYAAQGNEFSYFMLFASHMLLNCSSRVEEWVIQPWVHDPNNHMAPEDMLRPIRIPDICPAAIEAVNPGASLSMSMAAGSFESIYLSPSQAGQWDAVVTSFFLDCAPVPMEFADIIWHMLRPGGVWINGGPLQYHWSSPGSAEAEEEEEGEGGRSSGLDERYLRSVELSYMEVRYVLCNMGFQLLHEGFSRSTYAANCRSLLQPTYTVLSFTARKPVPGEQASGVPVGGNAGTGASPAVGAGAGGADARNGFPFATSGAVASSAAPPAGGTDEEKGK